MDKVQRWDVPVHSEGWSEECDSGEWVRYDDHAAALADAQATIARLEAALREIAQEPMNGDLMEPIIKRNLATARAALSPREGEG